MTPTTFPEANSTYGASQGFAETQIASVEAFTGQVQSGSVDGSSVTVVAWQPNPEEVIALVYGAPIFITFMGGLPPHMLTTNFAQAISPR